MANRMFKPLGGSLTQEVVCLTGKWTFHASDGTVASSDLTGFSVATVGTDGVQVITLEDTYSSILGVHITYEDASHASDETTGFELASEAVATTKLITLQHYAEDDGDEQVRGKIGGKTLHCMIWLKNSSV